MSTIKRTEKYENNQIIVNVPELVGKYNKAMKGSNAEEFMAIFGSFTMSGGRVYWSMALEGDTQDEITSEYLDDVEALECVAAGGKLYH
jgi:hypothetical protein